MKKLILGATAAAFLSSALAVPVVLNLTTDGFGNETAFTMALTSMSGDNILYDSWSSPTDPGDPCLDDGDIGFGCLLSDTEYTFTWDLDPGDYLFTIFDSFGDGICCSWGDGGYTLDWGTGSYTSDGTFAANDGDFEETFFTIDPPTVSEPGTMLLLGLGLIGLLASRRLRS